MPWRGENVDRQAAWQRSSEDLYPDEVDAGDRLTVAWSFVTEHLVKRLHTMVDQVGHANANAKAATEMYQDSLTAMARVIEERDEARREQQATLFELKQEIDHSQAFAMQLADQAARLTLWRERAEYLETQHGVTHIQRHTVKASDWQRIVALSQRKGVEMTPDDYLSYLIEQRAEQAGIEIEDGE